MTETVLGSPEDRAREDDMFINDVVFLDWDDWYVADLRDEDDDLPCDDSFDADDRYMDKIIDEELAARSPYRGMTREQREEYDRKFIENAEAGTFSLGDILREAILKKSRETK